MVVASLEPYQLVIHNHGFNYLLIKLVYHPRITPCFYKEYRPRFRGSFRKDVSVPSQLLAEYEPKYLSSFKNVSYVPFKVGTLTWRFRLLVKRTSTTLSGLSPSPFLAKQKIWIIFMAICLRSEIILVYQSLWRLGHQPLWALKTLSFNFFNMPSTINENTIGDSTPPWKSLFL